MDMLIFFGERRAGASGDFANALERQAIRVIMDAQLCGPVTPGGDDVRVLNALPPSQLSGKSGYAAISLIADIRKEERNDGADLVFHRRPAFPIGAPTGKPCRGAQSLRCWW